MRRKEFPMLSSLEKRRKPKVVSKSETSKLERRSVEIMINFCCPIWLVTLLQVFFMENVLVEELKRRLN